MGTKDDKETKPKKRSIKQVYLSEDGKEEKSVPVSEAKDEPKKENKKTEPDTKEHEEKEHDSSVNHGLRIAAIAVAMVASILLSMAVGVGLALWDDNRTFAELTTIVFAKEMPAETVAATDEVTPDPSSDELDDVPSDGDAQAVTEESEEANEPADYGGTIDTDTEGLSGVQKAGSDDEIVAPDDAAGPEILDPMADYPRPFTTVDESYFKDALFIGDSRLQGFGFWSGLPATYYCATGFALYKYDTTNVVQTENGKVPIFDAMPYDAFTKIYIKVGLNELGYGTEENFENTYAQLIAKLREYEPRAIIYVHAILPVTAAKSSSDKAHNNPNIRVRNASLEKFAKAQKAYFLDAGPVLSDENGDLRPEMTGDGIHLKPEYMKIWREYLCEHAVDVTGAQ